MEDLSPKGPREGAEPKDVDVRQTSDAPPGGRPGYTDERGRWIASTVPVPQDWGHHPRKKMLMTPWLVILGGIFAFIVPTITATLLQTLAFNPPISNDWAPLSNKAIRGRQVFLANGCVYCHSGFTRPQDVRHGLYYLYPRVSRPGDFATTDSGPNTFGSARIGPDLSQEGGFHPDDWHRAHFSDPRFVDPLSIMPRFNYLADEEVESLIAFLQERSGKSGLLRYAGELYMKKLFITSENLPEPPKSMRKAQDSPMSDVASFAANAPDPVDGTVDGLGWPDPLNLNHVDRGYWLMDNPMPVTEANLARGRMIFQERCIGCHGQGGAAISEAAKFMQPQPLPFVTPEDQSEGGDTSPGDFYYRVLRGIPGTAMENFGTRLKVDDIWKVVLFLKTIANGGLKPDHAPAPEDYIQWKPPDDFAEYVSKHPIDQTEDLVNKPKGLEDPFREQARRVLPGLNSTDTFTMPGYGEISIDAAAKDIRTIYEEMLSRNYEEYAGRGGAPAPSEEQKSALPAFSEELR